MNEIKPTLTDRQVLEFCQNGYLILEEVVPEETNRWVSEYLEKNNGLEPNEILKEQRFVNEVLLNAEAAGAVRSLLGKDFALPVLMSNHQLVGPRSITGSWH